MPLLFKVLDACKIIKVQSKLEKAALVLEDFSKQFNTLKVKKMELVNDSVVVGGKNVGEISAGLKAGKIENAKLIYDIDYISPQMANVLTKEVSSLPSFKVEQFLEKSDGLVKQLDDIPKTNLTIDDVAKNTKLKTVLEYMTTKKMLSFTAGTVIASGSIIYLIDQINKHREKLSGCFQYKTVNGKLVSCKINKWSCVNGQVSGDLTSTQCAPSPTTSSLTNCSSTTGYTCVNCPPDEFNQNVQDIDGNLNLVTDHDLTYYKCQTPTIADAIADIINDDVTKVENMLSEGTNAVTGLLSTIITVLKYIAIAVGVACVVGLAVFTIVKLQRFSKTNVDYKEL